MKTKGFTLVELLVVIAILAILATVSVVGFTSFIAGADEQAAITEAEQAKTIINAGLTLDDCVKIKNEGTTDSWVYVGTDGKYVVATTTPVKTSNKWTEHDATADWELKGTLSVDNNGALYYTINGYKVALDTLTATKVTTTQTTTTTQQGS